MNGKLNISKFEMEWRDGTSYRKGRQQFETFLKLKKPRHKNQEQKNMEFILSQIKELVPNQSKKIALEIGPGDRPVLNKLRFRQKIFMDSSEGITRKLKAKGKRGKKSLFVTWDIRALPFPLSLKERLGIIVVNEVLTHIEPKKRLKAVKELEGMSDSLLIIDRKQKTIKELKKEIAASGIVTLKRLEAKRIELIKKGTWNEKKKILTKIMEKAARYAKPSNYLTRHEQSLLVNFKPIVSFLKRIGWEVGTLEIGEHVVLKAKRKKATAPQDNPKPRVQKARDLCKNKSSTLLK